MPKGPKGEKRPADAIGAAVKSMKILTGEEPEEAGSTPNRAKGGKAGGKSRAKKLTPGERKRIAKKAAKARWGNK